MVVNDILTGDIRIHGDELYFISLEEDSKKNTFAFKTMERRLCRRKNDVSKHNERSKNSTDMFFGMITGGWTDGFLPQSRQRVIKRMTGRAT